MRIWCWLAMATLCGAQDPRSAQLWFERGVKKSAQGDLAGAVRDLSRAIELNSGFREQPAVGQSFAAGSRRPVLVMDTFSATAHYNRGVLRSRLGDLEGALADYSIALQIDPRHAFALAGRGTIDMEQERHAAALADFDRALAARPDMTLALNNRGNVRKSLGNLHGALADYNRLVELEDTDIVRYNRGALRFELRDYHGALADLSQALALNPELAPGYGNRSLAYLRLGNDAAARQDYAAAVRLDPKLGPELDRRWLLIRADRARAVMY